MTNSKRKGNSGEREVAELLRAVFPDARRRVVAEEAQRHELGRDIDGVPGWAIQVQLAKAPTIERKFAEAVAVAHEGETPVAFVRRCSRTRSGPWLAVLKAEDLIALMGARRTNPC